MASAGRPFLVTGQPPPWASQRGVRCEDWLLVCSYHDGWKDSDAVELYDLAVDLHETENLARDRPSVVERGLSPLLRWQSQHSIDTAIGQHGGNDAASRALVDLLLEGVHDGGPTYVRGNADSYTRRLREIGREEHAAEIEASDGIVEQEPTAFLE